MISSVLVLLSSAVVAGIWSVICMITTCLIWAKDLTSSTLTLHWRSTSVECPASTSPRSLGDLRRWAVKTFIQQNVWYWGVPYMGNIWRGGILANHTGKSYWWGKIWRISYSRCIYQIPFRCICELVHSICNLRRFDCNIRSFDECFFWRRFSYFVILLLVMMHIMWTLFF